MKPARDSPKSSRPKYQEKANFCTRNCCSKSNEHRITKEKQKMKHIVTQKLKMAEQAWKLNPLIFNRDYIRYGKTVFGIFSRNFKASATKYISTDKVRQKRKPKKTQIRQGGDEIKPGGIEPVDYGLGEKIENFFRGPRSDSKIDGTSGVRKERIKKGSGNCENGPGLNSLSVFFSPFPSHYGRVMKRERKRERQRNVHAVKKKREKKNVT